MVSIQGSSGESVDNGSEVLEVSSDSYSSGLDSSTSVDHSAIKGESSDFLIFLSQLPEKLGDNIVALATAVATQTGTSTRVILTCVEG